MPQTNLVTDLFVMATSGGDAVRVSAPGKVLLTGGYLILEERHSGLVLATSARFHTTISRRKASESAVHDGASQDAKLQIRVESPQFHQTILAVVVQLNSGRLDVCVSQTGDRNAYIEETLLCALNGIAGLDASAFDTVCAGIREKNEELYICLEADNAFYSQVTRLRQTRKEFSRRSLQELPPFLPPTMEEASSGKTSIAKTGLGSSAALVTSLVGAMIHFFVKDGATAKDEKAILLDWIHNLAQLSHCFVQRKIGSGFDVSTACYGTQRYSRFPPSTLDAFNTPEVLEPALIAHCVRSQALWRRPERVQPFNFPPCFRLLMGDVSTGSATVSMVKQVMQWQKANPTDSTRVISRLAAANASVEQSFRSLGAMSATDPAGFGQKCARMARVSVEEWTKIDSMIGAALYELRNHYNSVRCSFREMGELAGVPIEPPEQTTLIDATLKIPGVLIAGVPGAGGYDALFVIALDSTALDSVEKLWLEHTDTVICPLLCDAAASAESALSVEWL